MNERMYFLITHFYTLKYLNDFIDVFGANGFSYFEWTKEKFILDIGKKN
jgi:hypothetical protein